MNDDQWLTPHQIAARLVFAVGLGGVWWLFGIEALAGAGAAILLIGVAREIEVRGRQKQFEQERSQPIQSSTQLHD